MATKKSKSLELNRTRIGALAAYLTDPEVVVSSSIGLLQTQSSKATKFFALRDAFGVRGYATFEEAKETIERNLIQ